MKKHDIITKLQSMAASMREELNKNDGSTLQTISHAIKGGYENVRDAIAESDRTKKALTAAKQYLGEAGKAIKGGDRKLSAKALDALDKLLKDHKDGEASRKKKAPAKKTPAKATAAKKATDKTAAVKKTAAKPAAGKNVGGGKAAAKTTPAGKTAAKKKSGDKTTPEA